MSMAPSCRIRICRASDDQGLQRRAKFWISCGRRAKAEAPFEIVAGGTRRGAGKPMGDLPVLDSRRFRYCRI